MPKNCGGAAQEACKESVYRLQRNVVLIAGRELLEKFALQQAMCRSVPNWSQLSFVLVRYLDIVTLSEFGGQNVASWEIQYYWVPALSVLQFSPWRLGGPTSGVVLV